MSALIVDLCDSIVSAVNAASANNIFSQPLTAERVFAVDQALEATTDLRILVTPAGPFSWQSNCISPPGNEHNKTVLLVAVLKLSRDSDQEVEQMLLLLDRLYSEIGDRVPANTFELISGTGDAPYDVEKLRNSRTFWSETRLTFNALRDE